MFTLEPSGHPLLEIRNAALESTAQYTSRSMRETEISPFTNTRIFKNKKEPLDE